MSIINPISNVTNIIAENALSSTQDQLQTTLQQLSTGQELVSPAIAPANTSIAAGLNANISALTQSAQNSQSGVGELQTAAVPGGHFFVDESPGQTTRLLAGFLAGSPA